jgi:hypothetical protein
VRPQYELPLDDPKTFPISEIDSARSAEQEVRSMRRPGLTAPARGALKQPRAGAEEERDAKVLLEWRARASSDSPKCQTEI